MKLYKYGNPLISIILPTYNRANLIERAIKSVFEQSFQDFELIIVDDGSNDNTCELIQKHINHHPNVRYLKQQNMKLPLALNVGIQISTGNYITFINSDDIYLPDHLEKRINFMRQNHEIDLIYSDAQIIGDPYVKDKNDRNKLIHIDQCILGATFFGKKGVFTALNGFKEVEYSEDSEFFERARKKFKTQKVPFKTYVYYRDTEDSITNNI